MKQPEPIINLPVLKLKSATTDDHCIALREVRKAFFWWYMGAGRALWNFSLPFQDTRGNWWFQVKPGFCWPVDFLSFRGDGNHIPVSKKFLGYQHMVNEGERCNSMLVINVIEDLDNYDACLAKTQKARAIKKGAKSCELELMDRPDLRAFAECSALWRDFTARTGWKRPLTDRDFAESWGLLLDMPGVSVILGREAQTGRLAGFLITKIIGDTAYVDTIASATELMNTRVNNILLYSFIKNAQAIPHVKKVHYAIVSYKTSLERFKMSLGFKPCSYPAYTFFMPAVKTLVRKFMPDNYNRMTGQMALPG